MHLPTLTLLTTTLSLTTASASTLSKRCSPVRDPDLPNGYLPPAPCWQTHDPACQPYLAQGTEMTLDAEHRLAVVYGLSEHCAATIAEELRRREAGEKNFGWVEKHGWMTVIEPHKEGEKRILVLSGMSQQAVERYGRLTYMGNGPW